VRSVHIRAVENDTYRQRFEAAVRAAGCFADKLAGGEAQGVGAATNEVDTRIDGAALVVIDGGARGAEELGELFLGESLGFTGGGEVLAEKRG
jgi:hypothetical protein